MNKKELLKKILESRDKVIVNPIIRLKMELEKEDYKIIKCMEYSLVDKELPYDIEELNKKRDGLRERINELESKEG